MLNKNFLLMPGPTPVPERVQLAMARSMINHRGAEFQAIFQNITEKMKKVFATSGDILIFPAAGTGAMEASIVNLFSTGDKVLVLSIGVFGDRLADIAKNYGLVVEKIDFERGTQICSAKVAEILAHDTKYSIKGILFTHNETSTGVSNDIEAIAKVCQQHPAIKVVDAVSALGAIPMKMDAWGIDVVFTGSQKALMLPPGLGLVAFNERAWQAYAHSNLPKFYWDAAKVKKSLAKYQTPYTPALSLLYGLEESLQMIEEEGLDNIANRHEILSEATRQGIKALGLKLFAQNGASSVVTSVYAPEQIGGKAIQKHLREKYGIAIAGGQQNLENKIFRIGHLGYTTSTDIIVVIACLEMTLHELGLAVELGSGVRAVQQVLLQNNQ